MRIRIIRHAEPDYEIDGLTEKGKREAQLLKERLRREKIDDIYISPLGRAQLTAKPYLEASGKTAKTVDWLHEFNNVSVEREYRPGVCWDLLPTEWEDKKTLYDAGEWYKNLKEVKGSLKEEIEKVSKGLDGVLALHGYRREGKHYHVEQGNHDTIALFCHFGVECILLSHLFSVSPEPMLRHAVALPSSVTVLYTEERRKGIASFRRTEFGSLEHLYQKEPASFAARFCETFEDDSRHD